jgi:hypothetical protein
MALNMLVTREVAHVLVDAGPPVLGRLFTKRVLGAIEERPDARVQYVARLLIDRVYRAQLRETASLVTN